MYYFPHVYVSDFNHVLYGISKQWSDKCVEIFFTPCTEMYVDLLAKKDVKSSKHEGNDTRFLDFMAKM